MTVPLQAHPHMSSRSSKCPKPWWHSKERYIMSVNSTSFWGQGRQLTLAKNKRSVLGVKARKMSNTTLKYCNGCTVMYPASWIQPMLNEQQASCSWTTSFSGTLYFWHTELSSLLASTQNLCLCIYIYVHTHPPFSVNLSVSSPISYISHTY